MTDHHVLKSTTATKTPGISSFQWKLDQELDDHYARVRNIQNNIMSTILEPVGVVVGGSTNVFELEKDIRTPTHPHPPIIPPLPTSQAQTSKSDILCKVIEWLECRKITSVNYLLRNFTVIELSGAIDDYDAATSSGYKILYPTGFFRRLLERGSPDRQQPVAENKQRVEIDPDKYIKGRYGHMVQR